jgi:SagB-type dehydrogenase family enzyme
LNHIKLYKSSLIIYRHLSIFRIKIQDMKKLLFFIAFTSIVNCLNAQELKTLLLNPPDKTRGLAVMQAFSNRASANAWSTEKIKLQDLSDLLWAADGINRPDIKKRTAPSAMNSQDVDIYVFLPEGVYLYDAAGSKLDPVAAGDQRALTAGAQADVAKAPVILVLVSDISKFTRGEESNKLTMAALDAGMVSQNISLFCAGTGLVTRPRATMDQVKIREVLKLKDSQRPLINNPVSYPVK